MEVYPKPKNQGGVLLRRLVKEFRQEFQEVPLSSHIHIACSGGSDSVGLAVLLAKYGRRIVKAQNLTLIHLNHGWRGMESDQDASFVADLARRLGVGFITEKLKTLPKPGESWEKVGRDERKRFFDKCAKAHKNTLILTAHTADDLVETRLWRLFTGKWETHSQGILSRHGAEYRPFLSTRKTEIIDFLKEENQEWREDQTNHEGRFLRSKMRQELMPVIEKLFPKAVDHILNLK